ncbi:hypothetical protein OCE54_09150 [Bacillus cereus]|nr:hypothetical protein [Bacillus cereus]
MISKTKKLDIQYLENMCNELELKYSILKDSDKETGIRLDFLTKEGDELKIYLNMDVKSSKFYLLIGDILRLEKVNKKKEELLEELMIMNAQEIIYGNLGYLQEMKEVIYTHTVSLEERNEFGKEEFFDYIAYAMFLRKTLHQKYYINL